MKKTKTALLALLAIPSLGACGPAQHSSSEKPYVPSLSADVSGSVNIYGHYSNFEALEDTFNRFNSVYKNVKLKYTYIDSYNKEIPNVIKSDSAPDIFFTFPWYNDDESYAPLFEAAEDLSDENLGINLDCIRDDFVEKDQNGHFSIAPIFSTTYGMMINEDLFAKEGLSIPKTFSELKSVCASFKEKGYANPSLGYNKPGNTSVLYPLFFPHFCAQVAGKEEALKDLNDLKASAGEYMRSSLDLITEFKDTGCLNLEECNGLKNDYEAVLLRFFEGDIPIMFASGNTVSGSKKREAKSENFKANPFKYSFHAVPSTEQGGYFLNNIALGFSVNKNSKNLEVTNEFMRFLLTTEQLSAIAKGKRLIATVKDTSSIDPMFKSFLELPADRTIHISNLGLGDLADKQVRIAGSEVTDGSKSVDEAVAYYGQYK